MREARAARPVAPLALLAALALNPTSAAEPKRSPVPPPVAAPGGTLADEAISVLQQYLRLNTSNPPGNELAAARFWKDVFDREGIPCEIVAPAGSKRTNVVAKLPGSAGRGLVLLNHLDVVPADAKRWRHPPFGGEIVAGTIWGRGTTDMKGAAVAQAYVLIDLRRRGVIPARDLYFVGTADEETGREDGAAWLLANRRDLLGDAEYLLTEGAPARLGPKGQVESLSVVATEKSPLWLRVSAKGESGHASVPDPESAPDRLIRALARLRDFRPGAVVTPAARRYFAELADGEPAPYSDLFRNLDQAFTDPRFRQRLAVDPPLSAMLHDTCAITRFGASEKINVVPAEAWGELDCRLLPGESPQVFLSRLKIVAGDADLDWQVLSSHAANASPLETPLMKTIEETVARLAPGARVRTPVLTASNDAHLFRDAGLVAYGFDPFPLGDDEDRAHGDDERMPLDAFRFGFELYRQVVESFVEHPEPTLPERGPFAERGLGR